MNAFRKIALALTIIGALNWGVAGIFRFDVIAQLSEGAMEPLARLLYIIIGISGLISLAVLFDEWRRIDEYVETTHSIEEIS